MRVHRSTAFHEASHGVIAHVLGDYLASITIIPTDSYEGRTTLRRRPLAGMDEFKLTEDKNLWRVEHEIMIQLAGSLGQRRAVPRSRWWRGATGVKRGEFVAHGTDYHGAVDLIDRIYGEGKVANAFWKYLEARTLALIEYHWSTIERVAEVLIERRTLARDEVAEISWRESLRRAGKSDAEIDEMAQKWA
jgi:hypothetical protein